mmetsp:Transcript_72297/g.182298  ORF Transcript_72297/g.182298 Transcript_72297/m.182298 type:complete len:501 (-) Transcript_72297:167-1669(-)
MDDDTGGWQLSDQSGEGANSMSTMIQKHMTSILAPLAERVLDLEDAGKHSAGELKELYDRVDKAHTRLDQHDGSLGTLATGLERTKDELRVANENISEAAERHTALEGEHDATRTLTRAIDTSHKGTASTLSDTQRALEDLDNRARQLQMALSETNIAHLNINDRLAEIRNRQEGHNDRHLDLVKIVQEIRQSDENTRQALRRFTSTFDKQRRETERSFAQVDDRTRNFEASLVEMQHSIDGNTKTQKTYKSDLAQIRALLDNYVGGQQRPQQGKSDSSSATPARDLQGRVAKVEEAVIKLGKSQTADKNQTLAIVQTLGDAISKNGEEVGKHAQELEGIEKSLKNQDHRLQKGEQKSLELGTRHERLRENLEKCDADLRGLIGTVQREMTAKLDSNWHELSKTNASLSQAGQRIDAQSNGLQSLSGELNNTSDRVAKMGVSLDLAHEYFQGLTKGFQDTHKRVTSGQDGMLPPKGAYGGSRPGSVLKTLPMIQQTPRNS